MKYIDKKLYIIIALAISTAFLTSCYKDIANAPYPDQLIYMPTGYNGNYLINSVAIPGQTYRYTIDAGASKFNVPLSAFRSGIDNKGDVDVAIALKADTVNKLITSGALAGAELLPPDKYTLPTTATIANGNDYAPFGLSIDLNFLLANPTKVYALGVGVSSTKIKSGPKNITVVVISPAFLVPAANFTYAADSSTPKKYNFTNTSVNGVSYNWDFGDGTTVVTDKSPSHVYGASGTYTVTLTTTGAIGAANKAVKTTTVVVP